MERVTNAKGRWPLRESGMPTTQHSAIVGWEEMACSIEPENDQQNYQDIELEDLPVLNL